MSTNESLFDFGDDKDHSKSRSSSSKKYSLVGVSIRKRMCMLL